MSFTNNFYKHLFDQESGQAEIWLLRLIAPNNEFTQLNLCNNNESILSNGTTYEPFAFRLIVGAESDDEPIQFAITFDNVTLELIDEFRTITVPATVELDLILGDFPDQIESTFSDLKLSNISYDKLSIKANFIYDDILSIKVPSYPYGNRNFRGLF